MGEIIRLRTKLSRELASLDLQMEAEAAAQKAAEEHLAACQDALFAMDDPSFTGEWRESPSIAPFCGCDTCVIREVLHAAWPHVVAAAREELAREAR